MVPNLRGFAILTLQIKTGRGFEMDVSSVNSGRYLHEENQQGDYITLELTYRGHLLRLLSKTVLNLGQSSIFTLSKNVSSTGTLRLCITIDSMRVVLIIRRIPMQSWQDKR